MKRLLIALPVLLAVGFLSACSAGDPKPTTYISDTGATLNGDIYSNFSGDATYFWKYDVDTTYGIQTPPRTIPISDLDPHPVSEAISGLTPDTTYHFQLCVSDEEETPNRVNCQTDRTFTTSADPGTAAIAFSSDRDGNSDVHSIVVGGGGADNLTGNAAFDDSAAWSADSTQVAFTSFRSGNPDLWVMNADGSDQTNLTNDAAVDDGAAWSPDGTKIAYTSGQGPNAEVVVVDADGENATPLTDNLAFDGEPTWSPDGRRIAFTSDRDGNAEIYVMDADGANLTRLTTSDTFDGEASWSPDGQQIAFASFRTGISRCSSWTPTEPTRRTSRTIPGSTTSPPGRRTAHPLRSARAATGTRRST